MNQAESYLTKQIERSFIKLQKRKGVLKAERERKKGNNQQRMHCFRQIYPLKGKEKGVSVNYVLVLTGKFGIG